MIKNSGEFQSILTSGLEAMGLSTLQAPTDRLLLFIEELIRWNKVYNLTAIRNPDDMIYKHILDSLSIAERVKSRRYVLDVGTGAGLPGIPLALALPATHFTLLDSNHKKTRFIIHIVGKLSLTNVQVVCSRVEQFQPPYPYDLIVSRAYASLAGFVTSTQHLCKKDGRWLAMKGNRPEAEMNALNPEFMCTSHSLKVPARIGERHAIEIQTSLH
ncbi:MAG: 16S rRNA (guanine(527)-N(7))-methyltransferase RsmG [Gammaproteobacteria bacterium]|nr:16S rRNA (guanine(527)-N(7))-methyltransferase RsmG [Gammaproteobacteria bacterium]